MRKFLLPTVIAPLFIGAFATNAMEEIKEENNDADLDHALAVEARGRKQYIEHWDPDASPPKEIKDMIDGHQDTTQLTLNGYLEDQHVRLAADLLQTHQELKSPHGLAIKLHQEYGINMAYAKVLAMQVFREDHGKETEDVDPVQEPAKEIALAAKRRLEVEFAAIAAHELTSKHGLTGAQNALLIAHILDGADLPEYVDSTQIIPVK